MQKKWCKWTDFTLNMHGVVETALSAGSRKVSFWPSHFYFVGRASTHAVLRDVAPTRLIPVRLRPTLEPTRSRNAHYKHSLHITALPLKAHEAPCQTLNCSRVVSVAFSEN